MNYESQHFRILRTKNWSVCFINSDSQKFNLPPFSAHQSHEFWKGWSVKSGYTPPYIPHLAPVTFPVSKMEVKTYLE